MNSLTKLEIINEAEKFYKGDPGRRAVTKRGCEYEAENGNKCAVGRCWLDKINKAHFNGSIKNLSYAETGDCVSEEDIEKMFKPKYKGHSLEFWDDLQCFHDSPRFWQKNNLTEDGEYFLAVIKEKYK